MDKNNAKPEPRKVLKYVIIFGFLALVTLIAIPNFIRTHSTSSLNACINNLRQLDAAKQQWSLEKDKTNLNTAVSWTDLKPYLGRGAEGSLTSIYCPHDATKTCSNSYTLGDLGTLPKCKIRPAEDRIN